MILYMLFWDGIPPPNNEHVIGSRRPAQKKKKKKIHEIFVNINLIAVDRIPCRSCPHSNDLY